MANKVSKSHKKADPKFTRNGKLRLKPLSVSALETLLSTTSRPRDKDKIQRRLNNIKAHA